MFLFSFTSLAQAGIHEGKITGEMLQEKVENIKDLFQPGEANVNTDYQGNVTLTLQKLNFDFGQASLKPDHTQLLDNVYQVSKMFPDYKIRITGHTDSTGDSEFNKRLSQERAQSVAQYMIDEYNVPRNQLEIAGAGESQPIASNETIQGKMLNRRIEVTFVAP